MKNYMTEIENQIWTMTSDEITRIIKIIKIRRDQLHKMSASKFAKDDLVTYTFKTGRMMKCIVERVKVKYVVVKDTYNGSLYNIPGASLKKLNPAFQKASA